jgi:hypothetical protein
MEGGAVTAPGETTERRRLFSCPKRRVQSSCVSPLPRVVFRGAAGGEGILSSWGSVPFGNPPVSGQEGTFSGPDRFNGTRPLQSKAWR